MAVAKRALRVGALALILLAGSVLGGLTAHAEDPIPSPEPSPEASPSPSPSPSPPPPQTLPPPPPVATSSDPAPPPSGSGRRIVYAIRAQRVWLIETDGVARTYLVSGRANLPRPGSYAVYSKSRVSRAGRLRLDYMVRFARGRRLSIGFHAIPIGRRGPIQSEAELGKFRSHGCVRQRQSDAAALWNFAPIGTRVVVTP